MKLWESVKSIEGCTVIHKMEEGEHFKYVPLIYKIERATSIFGIYGKDWGIRDLLHKEIRINDNNIIGTLDATFFVKGTHETEFFISSSTIIFTQGVFNGNYRKCLESSLIGKALSRIGFFAESYKPDPLSNSNESVPLSNSNESVQSLDDSAGSSDLNIISSVK